MHKPEKHLSLGLSSKAISFISLLSARPRLSLSAMDLQPTTYNQPNATNGRRRYMGLVRGEERKRYEEKREKREKEEQKRKRR